MNTTQDKVRVSSPRLLQVDRPRFATVELREALNWGVSAQHRFEEKLDGEWCVREFGSCTLVGELVRGRTNGGNVRDDVEIVPTGEELFYAFDVIQYGPSNARWIALKERLALLDDVVRELREACHLILRPEANRPGESGGEFLQRILARGGEGVVAKDLSAPFGAEWQKAKRCITLDLVITERDLGKASVHLADPVSGEDRGWMPCRAMFHRLSVGEIIEVEAYGLHASGKLREARFVRRREDKTI